MAVICPKEGCTLHRGLCGHDVAMLALGALALLGSVAHWGLGLV